MRGNVNYQQTGALAMPDWSARHAKQMLRDFYCTGHNLWRKGIEEKPDAHVISAAPTLNGYSCYCKDG